MPNENARKREAPISYRPPKDRAAEFRALVAESGMSVNAFITERVFGARRRPADPQMLARLLARAADIRDQLHDIQRGAAGETQALAIEAALDELAEIRSVLIRLMGRKP